MGVFRGKITQIFDLAACVLGGRKVVTLAQILAQQC